MEPLYSRLECLQEELMDIFFVSASECLKRMEVGFQQGILADFRNILV
jgi:hypothetical protein